MSVSELVFVLPKTQMLWVLPKSHEFIVNTSVKRVLIIINIVFLFPFIISIVSAALFYLVFKF